MAIPAGLEPATSCLEGRCSIQLSYGTYYYQVTILLHIWLRAQLCIGQLSYKTVAIIYLA